MKIEVLGKNIRQLRLEAQKLENVNLAFNLSLWEWRNSTVQVIWEDIFSLPGYYLDGSFLSKS